MVGRVRVRGRERKRIEGRGGRRGWIRRENNMGKKGGSKKKKKAISLTVEKVKNRTHSKMPPDNVNRAVSEIEVKSRGWKYKYNNITIYNGAIITTITG